MKSETNAALIESEICASLEWSYSEDDGLEVIYQGRYRILKDLAVTERKGLGDQNAEWFCLRYQDCSLGELFFLLLNPDSDYYRVFFKPSWEHGKYLYEPYSIVTDLVWKKISDPCFQNPVIREALYALRNVFFWDRGFELDVMKLVNDFNDPKKEQNSFELAVSPLRSLMDITELPLAIRYRVAGFLDLSFFLRFLTPKAEKMDGFEDVLKKFIDVFRAVIRETCPTHQSALLRDCFELLQGSALGLDKSIGCPEGLYALRVKVILSIVSESPGEAILGDVHFLDVFFSEAVRLACGFSRTHYPDDHPLLNQVVSTFVDWGGLSSKESTFVSKCSAFFQELKQSAWIEKIAVLVACFTQRDRTQQYPFSLAWLCDVSQDLKLSIFNQFFMRPLIKQSYWTLSWKNHQSSDMMKKFFEDELGFYQILQSAHEQSHEPQKHQERLRKIFNDPKIVQGDFSLFSK